MSDSGGLDLSSGEMNSSRLPSGSGKYADPAASCAIAVRWPELKLNVVARQMLDGVLDRAVPLKAQIAVAGRGRNLSEGVADRAGTMDVELLDAKTVCPRAIAAVDELRPSTSR